MTEELLKLINNYWYGLYKNLFLPSNLDFCIIQIYDLTQQNDWGIINFALIVLQI